MKRSVSDVDEAADEGAAVYVMLTVELDGDGIRYEIVVHGVLECFPQALIILSDGLQVLYAVPH